MKTLKAIRLRRSVRKYLPDQIKHKHIECILNAGRLAPSAKNRQPWKFVVITNQEKICKIADIMIENHKNSDAKFSKGQLGVNSSVINTAKAMKTAPVLILVYKQIHELWETGDCLSIGACIENMCLEATELGLGSLWIRDTVYADSKILDYLEIDKTKFELNSALILGKPAESPRARPRNKLEDITTWIE